MRTPTPWILPTEPITRGMLVASGVSDAMIRPQLDIGRLRRIRQGVYVAAERWPSDPAGEHLLRARAELVANPGAVISHESAAIVWKLPTPGFTPWHDAMPSIAYASGGPQRSGVGTAARRVRTFGPGDVTRDPDGYAVTSVARTAVDLATGRELPESLAILDAAGRLLVQALMGGAPRTKDYANPRLVQAAREMLSGALAQRSALRATIESVVPCRESVAESLTAGHLHLSGLPMPTFQSPVRTERGTYYLDMYWPELGLVGECDGAVKYTDPEAYVAEKKREQVLRDLGYRIVRWLAAEIMTRPDIVLDRIARAMALKWPVIEVP